MRFLLKLLALVIFGPVILGLLLVIAIVAIVAVPILFEELTARLTSPPKTDQPEQPLT